MFKKTAGYSKVKGGALVQTRNDYDLREDNGGASFRFDPDLRFHTELFGFDRVEVLSYIERISAANEEKARALEETITALQHDLTGAHRQGSVLEQKANQVFSELEFQKKRAEDAVAEAAVLRTEMDKANDEIAAVRSRLFAQEQENETLRNDNTHLNETVADLTRALQQRGMAQPEWRVENTGFADAESEKQLLQQAQLKARGILRAADEKAQAHIERAKQDAAAIVAKAQQQSSTVHADLEESAGGIAASIAVLKAQLAEVDAKILAATSDLQKATDGIAAALNDTDQSLSAWNSQGKSVPAAAPAAAVQPQAAAQQAILQQQPAMPQTMLQQQPLPQQISGAPPMQGERPGFYESIRREEDAYYNALRRVQYEDALRQRIYEEELRRARADAAAQGEDQAARRVQKEKRKQAAQPLLPGMPQSPDTDREAARPRYRETNGQPLPQRAVQTEGNRSPAIPREQYDAMQYENRVGMHSAYPEVPEMSPQPVVQKVEIPQVPAAKQPDSDAQVIFGKPHAPRAMPFAPFDPYTPHTAPYLEPEAEAARILNTPPPPPPRGTEARRPYVPQPTPIAPSAPLSEPYVQPSAMVLAGMPQTQPGESRSPEPVIIPYSMPIPKREAQSAAQEAPPEVLHTGKASAVAFEPARTHTDPASAQKGQASALSDDLLNHLNQLLNGEPKQE